MAIQWDSSRSRPRTCPISARSSPNTDGRAAFRQLLTPLIGKIHNPARRMVDPVVRAYGEAAVLTYVLVYDQLGEHGGWNVTEIYRRIDGKWRLIHSQWAEAKVAKP